MCLITNDRRPFLLRQSILRGIFLGLLLFAGLRIQSPVYARQTNAPSDTASSATGATPEEQLSALKLEMTNAWQHVLQIVNQPVKAYARPADTEVARYTPGWFHPGAMRPDFNTVDVRQTQELNYAKSRFVTSDLNPGLVFLGLDVEFNSMTKFFYTDRTRPKHKLTEAEMLEINRLYRIIGRCDGEIRRLLAPPGAEAVQPATAETETEQVVPGQSFEAIRRIPKQTRILYGGIAIGVLIILLVGLRFLRKQTG